MADRYWVGGTDSWNVVALLKWSTTSGGVGGAAVPTAADDVYFDANSGTGTVTFNQDGVCRNLSFTSGSGNFAGTFTFAANLTASGSITIVSGMTLNANNRLTLNSTTTGNTIQSAGKTLPAITFNGAGGGWQLLGNVVCQVDCTLTAGAVDLNNFSLTAPNFLSNNSNVRSIAFGASGSLVLTGSGANLFTTQTVSNWSYTGSGTVIVANNSAIASTINTGGPSEAFTLNFYFTTGTYALSESGAFYKTLDFTGFAGTLPNTARRVYGNLVVSSGMTLTAGVNATTFISSSATPQTITTNGKTLDFPLIVSAPAGTYRLIDSLTIGATRSFTLTRGTFDANGKNVSVGSFALGSGTKTLTLGTGTWTVVGSGTAWDANTNVANLTVSASTGTINMTSASAKTFAGGAKVWPTLNQGGSGALTIQQSNTFANITDTVQPATVTLTAGTTQTVGAFGLAGTAGNLITLNTSSAGSTATLTGGNIINSVSFVSIKDIIATGGSVWSAPTSNGNVDAGNNTGWNFNDLLFRYIYTRRKNKVIFPI
jgi:hypothetical protein